MATLYVGSDQTFLTIKDAIKASSAGDTIIVSDGDYTAEGEIMLDKALTLKAANAGKVTVDHVVLGKQYHDPASDFMTVSGLVIKPTKFNGGDWHYTGVWQNSRSIGVITIENCTIDFTDTPVGNVSVGVKMSRGEDGDSVKSVVITGCEVIGGGNTQYGISLGTKGSVETVTISGNTISNTTGNAVQTDFAFVAGKEFSVAVNGNTMTDCGGFGVHFGNMKSAGASIEVSENTFTNQGKAAVMFHFTSTEAGSLVITDNEVTDGPVGFDLTNITPAAATVTGNTISNITTPGAVGIVGFTPAEGANTIELLEPAASMIVDASITAADGEVVTIGGKKYLVGVNAFTTVQAAVDATLNDVNGSYTIALNGVFSGDVAIESYTKGGGAADPSITFVKAEGAEAAAITGKVSIGYTTSPSNKGAAYAWDGNLRFEGITFDYTEAVSNGTRFEILASGVPGGGNKIEIVDCVFNGPGMINAAYNGGQASNNNGDPNGDNAGNLFCTPWGAATDNYQGVLSVTGTTFNNGNINFWRDAPGWSFTDCTFNNAPVTLLGNKSQESYVFTDCEFNLDLDKVDDGIAAYLFSISENALGFQLKGGSMVITGSAEGKDVTYILSQAPNADNNKAKADIALDGVQVTVLEGVKFLTTKSPAETDGSKYTCDTVASTFVSAGSTGLEASDLAGAANATLITKSEDGNVSVAKTDADGVLSESTITEIFVDAAYTDGYAGKEVAENVYLGFNAFNSFVAALENVSSDITAISINGDIVEKAPESDTTIELSKDLTVSGGNVTWENAGNTKLYFDKAEGVEGAVKVNFAGAAFDANTANTIFNFGEDVQVNIDKDSAVKFYSVSVAPNASVNVEEGGVFDVVRENLSVAGQLTITGSGQDDARQAFIKYSGVQGQVLLADTNVAYEDRVTISGSGDFTASNSRIDIGKNYNGEWFSNPSANGIGQLRVNGGSFALEDNSVLMVSGGFGKGSFTMNVNAGAEFSISGDSRAEFAGGITNAGTINIDSSRMDVATEFAAYGTQPPSTVFVNSGNINISGTGSISVADWSNSGTVTVDLAGFKGYSAAVIEVRGENSVEFGNVVLKNGDIFTTYLQDNDLLVVNTGTILIGATDYEGVEHIEGVTAFDSIEEAAALTEGARKFVYVAGEAGEVSFSIGGVTGTTTVLVDGKEYMIRAGQEKVFSFAVEEGSTHTFEFVTDTDYTLESATIAANVGEDLLERDWSEGAVTGTINVGSGAGDMVYSLDIDSAKGGNIAMSFTDLSGFATYQLLDAAGNVIGSGTSNSGFNKTFTGLAQGGYTLVFSSEDLVSGDVSINVANAKEDAAPESWDTAAAFAIADGTVGGLEGSKTYNFAVAADTVGDLKLTAGDFDSFVKCQIFDGDGNVLWQGFSNSGFNKTLTGLAAGSYQIVLSADKESNFDLNMEMTKTDMPAVEANDPDNDRDTTDLEIAALGNSITDWVGASDSYDWIDLDFTATGYKKVSLQGTGSKVTAEVWRVDGEGNEKCVSTFSATNSTATRKVMFSAGYDYFVKIVSADSKASASTDYTLAIN